MRCAGILVWFPLADRSAAILECSACGFVIVTGNFFDSAHAECEILMGA